MTMRTYDHFESTPQASNQAFLSVNSPAVARSQESNDSLSPALPGGGGCRFHTRDDFETSPAHELPPGTMIATQRAATAPYLLPQQPLATQQMLQPQHAQQLQPGMPQVMMAPQQMAQGMQGVPMQAIPQGMQAMPQGMQAMMMAPQMMMQQGQLGQPPQMMMVMMPVPVNNTGACASTAMPMMMAAPQVMQAPGAAGSYPASGAIPAAAPMLPFPASHGAARAAKASGDQRLERVPTPAQAGKPWLRQTSLETGRPCIQWNVDARRFGGNNTKAVSPEFTIDMSGGQGPQPFKLMIVPVVNPSKGGGGGRHSKQPQAWGKLELKCLAELSQGSSRLEFSLGIGSGALTQALRGPIAHDFAVQTSGGLRSGSDEWDFGAAMDSSAKTVLVRLDVISTS